MPGRLPASNPTSLGASSSASLAVANRETVDATDTTPSSYASSRSRRCFTLCRSVATSRARPRHPPAASSDFSSFVKSTLSSPTSRLMIARRRSFSARTVLYRPASRSARALASRALSFHSARSLEASSAAFAASATTSRHAFSICDSVRGVPSSYLSAPACKPPGARPVPARAALSSVTSRAFSAFSFSTASVSERFFLAISTIFDSRTPAASRSPPVSSAALSSAHSRSFASSACTSSWLWRVSSWTCASRWRGGSGVVAVGRSGGNTCETVAAGTRRTPGARRASRAKTYLAEPIPREVLFVLRGGRHRVAASPRPGVSAPRARLGLWPLTVSEKQRRSFRHSSIRARKSHQRKARTGHQPAPPEIKPDPVVKPDPEIKQEPFTIRGCFGIYDSYTDR